MSTGAKKVLNSFFKFYVSYFLLKPLLTFHLVVLDCTLLFLDMSLLFSAITVVIIVAAATGFRYCHLC